MRRILLLIALGVCAVIATIVYLPDETSGTPARSEAEALQRALLDAARERPEDPSLGVLFRDLNAQHFGGELPSVKVLWDEDLHRLDSGEYRQNGMTDGRVILLNSALKDDPEEVRRTLCHEMVHVELMTARQRSATHDAEFQLELDRIFDSGCFEAIRASDEESAALKAWIDAERERIGTARLHAEALGATVKLESERVEQTIADLNARIARANAAGAGWPSPDETAAAERQRTAATENIAAYNRALEALARDQAAFNEALRRYHLMLAYPDGLAEDRARGASRRE